MQIQPYLFFDRRCQGRPSLAGFALTVTAPGEAEAKRNFAALAEGGHRFGVAWMLHVEA